MLFRSYTTKGIDDGLNHYDAKYNWNFFNPKFGVLYKIKSQHQVYASYAMGSREPNRDDVLAALAANKYVKPEKLQDVEAGYKFLHPQFPLNINLYFMDYKDQLVLTGKLNDVGNPIKENVAKSYRAGIELNGSFHVYRHWGTAEAWHNRKVFSINYSFTYSLNKIKSFHEYIYTYDDNYAPVDSFTQVIKHKNSNISFSPNIIASLELAAYPFEGFEISLINKAVSKQYLDNTSNENRKIKPFFYSNLRLTYKLPLHRENKEIKLTLLLNNIFNRFYESNGYTYSERYYSGGSLTPVSTYNYFNPQAGFNILGGISVRF